MKLNLGCGGKKIEGFINVDKFPTPATDLLLDLETPNWPWEDDSINEIHLIHCLEHLGKDTETYFNIFKELYRICKNGAIVEIHVPHPRHDNFLGDPTHVRPITPQSLTLFDADKNREWLAGGMSAATPLGIYLNVNFQMVGLTTILDPHYQIKLARNELTIEQVIERARELNNVIAEYHIKLQVKKQ